MITILALVLMASCTVQNETSFKEDFSGTTSTTINFKEFFDFMGKKGKAKLENASADEKAKAEAKEEKERIKSIEKIKGYFMKFEELTKEHGMSNFKYEDGQHETTVTYDFKDIKALNYACTAMAAALSKEEKVTENFSYFGNKGKKLSFTEKKKFSEKEQEGLAMFKKNYDSFKQINVFHFAKALKKFKGKGNAKLSDDKKTITINSNLGEMSKGVISGFDVKF